jgi:hypothetical protein
MVPLSGHVFATRWLWHHPPAIIAEPEIAPDAALERGLSADDQAAGDTAWRDVKVDGHQAAMPHCAFSNVRSGRSIRLTSASCSTTRRMNSRRRWALLLRRGGPVQCSRRWKAAAQRMAREWKPK